MCTVEKRGNIFILTLTGDGDNDQHRFNPTVITAIRSSISSIKSQSATALVTTATGKFFSNGLDLNWATTTAAATSTTFRHTLGRLVESFKPLVADLISLPFPTIAAVTGHASAAGFLLAMSHDYVFMSRGRNVLYMSELDIGMTFPEYFNVLFRERLGSMAARREVMLRAGKIKADDAVRLGIVDEAYDSGKEVVEAGVRLGEELVKRKWNGDVYAEIRKGLYPELCKELGLIRKVVVVSRL